MISNIKYFIPLLFDHASNVFQIHTSYVSPQEMLHPVGGAKRAGQRINQQLDDTDVQHVLLANQHEALEAGQ